MSEPVDRHREIAAIEAALDAAAGGSGRVLVVGAGAGAGKTALLDAAVGRARRAGFTVLAARGSATERDLPFGLVNRLLEPVLRQPAGTATARPGTAPPPAADEMPPAELRALHEALAGLAARTPVLLAVDDLQWLDRQSLHWLSTLPPRADHARIAVLLTVCRGEPCADPAILDELLAAAAAELHPAALGAGAVRQVLERALGEPVDAAFLAAAVRLTAGNPLCATELAAGLADQGVRPTAAAAGLVGEVPVPRLAARTHARLRRMAPHALDVARAVAVLGPDAELGRIREVCGLRPDAVMEAVTVLNRAGVLRVADRTAAFVQPLLRTTLLRQAPFAELQTLHTRAARVLRAAGAGEDRVAEQLAAAPALAEPWAVQVLREAAEAALGRGDARRAATYLGRALSEPVPDDLRAPLLAELGRSAAYTDLPAAIRHLSALGDRPADRAAHPGAIRELAGLLTMAGRQQAAAELLARPGAPADADHALCSVEVGLDGEHTAEEAAELLARMPRPASKGGAAEGRYLSLLALRTAWAGRSRSQAVALAQQALAALPATPAAAPAVARGVLVLAQAGRVEDAHQRADALVGHAERWGHGPLLAAARSVRAEAARRLGRTAQAADDTAAALELLAACGAPGDRGAVLEVLARRVDVLADQGGLDTAAALLHDRGLDGDLPPTWAGAALLIARGRLRAAAGLPAEGLRDLLAAGARLQAWHVDNPAVAPWRSAAAAAALQSGEPGEARRQAAEAVEAARRWGAPGPLGAALRVQGAVLGGARGLAALKESVAVLERSAVRPELARSLAEYGTALVRAQRTAPARRVLRAALELAEQGGWANLAHRARIELTASGGRPPRTPGQGGVAGLTAAELRAALLAARGMTNRELAEALQVRQRTVEIHLTQAYRKLGIGGRDELPAALHGPAPAGVCPS